MDELVDIAAPRPRDDEQLQLLADRLQVPLARQWRRTLRWAGRHADAIDAECIMLAAQEAGIRTLVRPSHPAGRFEQFVTAHAGALSSAAFIAASVGILSKLFFFHDYRAVIHFLGLLWLHLVTRDQTVFQAVGVTAGIGASVATGYVAMISVHCALAWTRLSPPLVATTKAEVIGDIHPVPAIRSFDWRRLRLVGGAAATAAILWFAATIVIHRYVRGDLPAALAAIPEANRAQLPLPADPWKARDELQDRSRPRPDRRFLRGLADVDRLVLGAQAEPRIEWAAGGWRVDLGAQLVGSLPATPSFADGLGLLRSRVKQIAGASLHAVSWGPTGITDLGSLGHGGNACSVANGINNAGVIVGYSCIDGLSFDNHAVRFRAPGVIDDLGTLGGDWAWANVVNGNGMIVGGSRTLAEGVERGFVYTDATGMADAGVLPGMVSSGLLAVNSFGLAVGESWGMQGGVAILYGDGRLTNLNDLLEGNPYAIEYARGVTDSGEIIATTSIQGQSHAVLLLPQ